jgi:hypothetical protein
MEEQHTSYLTVFLELEVHSFLLLQNTALSQVTFCAKTCFSSSVIKPCCGGFVLKTFRRKCRQPFLEVDKSSHRTTTWCHHQGMRQNYYGQPQKPELFRGISCINYTDQILWGLFNWNPLALLLANATGHRWSRDSAHHTLAVDYELCNKAARKNQLERTFFPMLLYTKKEASWFN